MINWMHRRLLVCFSLLIYMPVFAASTEAQQSDESVSTSLQHFNTQVLDRSSTAPFTEGYVTVDGLKMHYVAGGSGKLLVFYHGFPAYWYHWKHQLKTLSKHYRVVALDALGANLSDKPAEVDAYQIGKLAHQLDKVIQELADDRPYVLIGHDWGGALAWAHAQQNPAGLEKLVVLNAPPYNLFLELLKSDPRQQKASSYVYRLSAEEADERLGQDDALGMWQIGGYQRAVERGLLSEAESQLFRTALARPGVVTGGLNWYRANIPPMGQITEEDFWPSRTAGTKVNSMLIWGSTDRIFIPEFIDRLADYTDQLRVEVLPGIGHSPHIESPDKVSELIRDFVESD